MQLQELVQMIMSRVNALASGIHWPGRAYLHGEGCPGLMHAQVLQPNTEKAIDAAITYAALFCATETWKDAHLQRFRVNVLL